MKKIIMTIMSLAILLNMGSVATASRKRHHKPSNEYKISRKKHCKQKEYIHKTLKNKKEIRFCDKAIQTNEKDSEDEDFVTPVGDTMYPKEVLNRFAIKRINLIMDSGDEFEKILKGNEYLNYKKDNTKPE